MTAANVSHIPANAPKPQDRKPRKRASASAAARQAEAEAEYVDGYVTIEQCGVQLRIPVGGKVPLDAYLVFIGDEETLRELGIRPQHANVAGTRLLLGAEQWAEFREKNPTLDDFEAIGDQLKELSGN